MGRGWSHGSVPWGQTHGTEHHMTDTTLQSYLADHPRAIGILFMLLLLLAEAEPVLGGSTATHGP